MIWIDEAASITEEQLDAAIAHLRKLPVLQPIVTWYSRRYFRSMTDAELLAWRPEPHNQARSANISKANREYRRRAARAGFGSVYDWMRANQ